ncbi:MAG: Ldh family oxidoreductase [Cyanobacteriota bacterium]
MTPGRVRNICLQYLRRHGASEHEAEVVFEDYLDAEMRGRHSHGLGALDIALKAFPTRSGPKINIVSPGYIRVDGCGGSGHVVAREAIDIAINQGLPFSILGLRDIWRFNSPGAIARFAGDKGWLSVVVQVGGPAIMAPWGGRDARLGNSPIGIAIPHVDPMLVLDVSMAAITHGAVIAALRENIMLPPNVALAGNGAITEDPFQATATLPFGHKGYGLAVSLELLGGLWLDVPIGRHGQADKRGAIIVLLRADDCSPFHESLDIIAQRFLADLQDASGNVLYPGQGGEMRRREVLKSGFIEISDQILHRLVSVSQQDEGD